MRDTESADGKFFIKVHKWFVSILPPYVQSVTKESHGMIKLYIRFGGGYFKEEQIQYQRNLTLLFLDCGSHQHCVPELSRAAWAVGPVKTAVDQAHMLFSWTRRKALTR